MDYVLKMDEREKEYLVLVIENDAKDRLSLGDYSGVRKVLDLVEAIMPQKPEVEK